MPTAVVIRNGALWRHDRRGQHCRGTGARPLPADPVVYVGPDAGEMSCNSGLALATHPPAPRNNPRRRFRGVRCVFVSTTARSPASTPTLVTLISTTPDA